MTQPYNIGVKVGADIDPLRKGLRNGSREVQSFSSVGVSAMRTLARGFAVATTAAVATGAAVMKLASDASGWASNITELSDAAGITAESFQEMAFAAKTVGIEQGKLANIIEDMARRVGKFAEGEGGQLSAFFENIAPLVGVSIDDFKELSGPQALQLYYDSLVKAQVPQKQMIFYLNEVSGGAQKLIPLLKNGGEGFKNLADQARAAGGIIDNDGVAALSELNNKLDELKTATKGAGRAIAELLTPEINRLVEKAIEGTTRLNQLIQAVKRSRENREELNALDEKALEIIKNQSDETKKGTIVQQAAAQAINDRLVRQNELRDEAISYERRLMTAVQTRNIADQKFSQERLQSIVDEQIENDKMIEFLRHQSAEAQKILDLRRGITEEVRAAAAAAEESVVTGGFGDTEIIPAIPGAVRQGDGVGEDTSLVALSFSDEDRFATEQELLAQHWEEMNRIAVEGAGGIAQIMAQQWDNAVGSTAAAGKSMLESFSQSSRKMFEINKAWGVADAIVSTAQGIAAGVKLGWPMGIPAVAWAVANGAAQISRIRSTQFGGGGSAPAAVSAAPQGQTAPGTNEQGGQESGRTLRIEGLRADSLYTGNQLQSLASNLEEFWNDGGGKGRVIFAGDK